MIRAAMELPVFLRAGEVLGFVEIDNTPARRLLGAAGFTEGGLDDDGLVSYRYAPSRAGRP
jgi:RimJ/RimL family protein N-acetyltransferase